MSDLPPDPHSRSSTFSKRHASFDSPREVPLPSPSKLMHSGYFPAFDSKSSSSPSRFPIFEEDEPTATSPSPPPNPDLAIPPIDNPTTTTISTPIFPFSRPYSLPSTLRNTQTLPPGTHWTDRYSSASLPLPANVPFHTLPKAGQPQPVVNEDAAVQTAGDAHAARVRQAHRSEVGTEPPTSIYPYYPYNHPPPPPAPSSSSGSGSRSGSGSGGRGTPEIPLPEEDEDDDLEKGGSLYEYPHIHPPLLLRRRRSSDSPSYASSHPPRPATSPQYPPPHRASYPAPDPHRTSYPAPDPPTILAPTVSPAPFLSHLPPPPDSWIEVETSAHEYRLVVRLPGFRRDGITLATKRRRVLHVVADSWEGGGGHFERRISFGYDADLIQVRAEFDGEMLRISIPRRLPPVDLWPQQRPGPIGRSG
ncbi:hypothetical protein C0991_005291 [Blastosporella zonata]|nr:hypothetical protein C0991_005291 [Blastosporella zonata]